MVETGFFMNVNEMIPKIIHYCRFGPNSMSTLSSGCIASWKRYLPDYEIKEWNESNFDIHAVAYTKEAYELKKYAFVNDYVRLYALYKYGGIYLDANVEILKSLNPLLHHMMFSGFDSCNRISPRIVFGSEARSPFIKEMAECYAGCHYIRPDGTLNNETVVVYITRYFVAKGLKINGEYQVVADFAVYPANCFSHKSFGKRLPAATGNTYSIYHSATLWQGKGYYIKRFLCDRIDRVVARALKTVKRIILSE